MARKPRSKKYNPLDDPIVKASLKATTSRARNKVEKPHIVNTDNGPAVTDIKAIADALKKRGKK